MYYSVPDSFLEVKLPVANPKSPILSLKSLVT